MTITAIEKESLSLILLIAMEDSQLPIDSTWVYRVLLASSLLPEFKVALLGAGDLPWWSGDREKGAKMLQKREFSR